MNVLRQGVKTLLTALLPRERLLASGPRSASGIALTLDDGPHPEHTPRLLDELDRHQIKATFFVVGQAAERHADIVRRIAEEGHTLGTHTYTHSEPAETSAATMLEETRRSINLIADLTGQRPTLFRPPKGKLTLKKTLGLWKLQQSIVLWNQDPRDYQAGTEHGIQMWFSAYVPQRGDIVLLHDTHPHCIGAIRSFADRARDCGLEFSTIDEFVGRVGDLKQDRSRGGEVVLTNIGD